MNKSCQNYIPAPTQDNLHWIEVISSSFYMPTRGKRSPHWLTILPKAHVSYLHVIYGV